MNNQHPIEGLMATAMNSIENMIDVNTIIGEPIETNSNIIIIPISKVGFGFASGGSEFKGETIDEYSKKEKEEDIQYRLPFGGGSGAGVSISPVAFLVVQPNNVKLLPIEHNSCVDKLIDYVPDLVDKLDKYLNKSIQNKKEEKKDEMKAKEKARRDLQSTLDNTTDKGITDNIQTSLNNRIRPKRSKIMPRQDQISYEYEYNEIDNRDDNDNEIKQFD